MKHLIVNYRKDSKTEFINIPCDAISQENGVVYGYSDGRLVAAVDLGCLDMLYLSEQR